MSSGYRSVAFMSLCRLCITGQTTTGTNIFSAEGRKRKLSEKIKDCLPAVIEENDSLPKIVCSQCIDQIESISQYRSSCLNAQVMLEGCLISGTIKSGGKVYIKEPSVKGTVQVSKISENEVQTHHRNSISTNTVCRENNSPLEEFLKIKPNVKMSGTRKKDDVQYVIQKESKPNPSSLVIEQQPLYNNEVKDKKFNIVLAPTLSDHLYSQIESSQSFSSNILQQTIPQNSSFKQYLTKLSSNNQIGTNTLAANVNTKQCMLPITIKTEGSADKQIIAHINTKNLVLPTYQLQMKFQPNNNADRQTVVQLTPTSVPISLQPVPSNFNQFHVNNSNTVPFYLTEPKTQNTNIKAQTTNYEISEKKFVESQVPITSEKPAQLVTVSSPIASQNLTGIPSKIANVFLNKPGITINRISSTTSRKPKIEIKEIEITPPVAVVNSSSSNTTATSITKTIASAIPEFKCKVCHKSFKKKEHMTQHMKLHAGLRPFKCNEQFCNKAFSRKEHLMRHMVSHTGKKLFHCDICQKFFSRKDNLNKHRRTHTENSNNNGEFVCEICQKCFVVKMYYVQHKLQCLKENSQTSNSVKIIET